MWFYWGKSRIKYSGSGSTVKDAPDKMGTGHSTKELAGYQSVLVWAKSTGALSRYKASKVILRGSSLKILGMLKVKTLIKTK
jgi:hypothetical protein